MKRFYQRLEAAEYLGMSARSFDVQVSPYLPYVLVGRTGKRYDARDLDAWVDAQPPRWAPSRLLNLKDSFQEYSRVKAGVNGRG